MSNTDYLGRKITGFPFEDRKYGMTYTIGHSDRIGEVGLIEIIYPEEKWARVKFYDGRKLTYPLSLIEQHLVPESGGEPESNRWLFTEDEVYTAMNWMKHQYDKALDSPAPNYPLDFTTKEGGDEFMKRLDKAGIDLEKFMLSLAKNGAEARAQSIVNAEAYRVENERLRAALVRAQSLINDIDITLFHHTHEVMGWHRNDAGEPIMNFVAGFDMDAINEIKSALEPNT